VPTGVALSTEAVQRVPRERAERGYADIRRWTEFPRGGHFLAAEDPGLLAQELREFFRPFRQTR
jgi:pimeloyl-ACP methyl ester carboxylesterase